MPFLNPQDFQKVRDALQSGHDFFAGADLEELADAIKMMDDAQGSVASVQLRDLAESIYGSDEIEIDDEGVGTSVADNGTWVQAWVWVPQGDIVVTEGEDA